MGNEHRLNDKVVTGQPLIAMERSKNSQLKVGEITRNLTIACLLCVVSAVYLLRFFSCNDRLPARNLKYRLRCWGPSVGYRGTNSIYKPNRYHVLLPVR